MTHSSISVPISQPFSPDKLHRVLHDIARLTLAGQSAAARCALDDALCDVEAWLLQATDVGSAYAIIDARAAARLQTLRMLAEPFDPPPPEPQPRPRPPHGPQPYPREVA